METLAVVINLIGALYFTISLSLIGKPLKENLIKYSIYGLSYFTYIVAIEYVHPAYIGSNIEPFISLSILILLYIVIFRTSLFDSMFYVLFGFIVLASFELIELFVFQLFNVSFDLILTNLSVQVGFEIPKLIFIIFMTKVTAFRRVVSKIENLIPYVMAAILNIFIYMQLVRILTNWILNGKTVSYFYLFAFMLAIFIINGLLIRFAVKSQRELMQVKSYNEYEKMIVPLIENSRAIEHDFKNHLLTLKALAQNNNQDEFNSYLNSINEEIKGNSVYKICNNPVMGALLQEKANSAEEQDIDFKLKVFEDSTIEDIIKPYHSIALLSNLIDNAFEEVVKIEEKQRLVTLEYKKSKNIQINIKNSLADKPNPNHDLSSDKKRFSTKGSSRGYGLSNVKKIVKSYNGDFNVFHLGDEIEIKITLNPQTAK